MSVPSKRRAARPPAAATPTAVRRTPVGPALREAIHDRILRAVLEHRLPPGTRLVEDRLAERFETSRAQARDALARLANDGIVQTIPNCGAFIAAPTVEQTREVFEARRLIEPALVRRLIALRGPAAVAARRRIVAADETARARQDCPTIVWLSGEFHIRLARGAGNVCARAQHAGSRLARPVAAPRRAGGPGRGARRRLTRLVRSRPLASVGAGRSAQPGAVPCPLTNGSKRSRSGATRTVVSFDSGADASPGKQVAETGKRHAIGVCRRRPATPGGRAPNWLAAPQMAASSRTTVDNRACDGQQPAYGDGHRRWHAS